MRTKICFCCTHNNKDKENETEDGNIGVDLPVTGQPISKTFEQQCLEEHNRLRALHGCPPLKLNKNLSAYAAEWANTLANQNIVLEYRTEDEYGENLFVARDYNVDARIVVKCWYDEIFLYNFSKPGYVHGVDHFTQVIWKDTKEIGVGVRKRGGTAWIVVNYEPKGNISDKFEQNVPKPITIY